MRLKEIIQNRLNQWKVDRNKAIEEFEKIRAEKARLKKREEKPEKAHPPIFSNWTWEDQRRFDIKNRGKTICVNCKHMTIDDMSRDRICTAPGIEGYSFVFLQPEYPLCEDVNDGHCRYYAAEEIGKRWRQYHDCGIISATYWEKSR